MHTYTVVEMLPKEKGFFLQILGGGWGGDNKNILY